MKSSDPRQRKGTFVAAFIVAAMAVGVSIVRPAVASRYHELRVTSDVYALPSPDQMVVASLGYRSALADLIYGHVLVSYGLHFQEDRRFEFVGEYIDTMNALDPTFREPYRYADTLLVFSPEPPRLEDYLKAEEVFDRGLDELPYDTELWSTAGQYFAYLAAPHLKDPEMKKAWRVKGAKILSRACELESDNEHVPYHCITAATLLTKAGEREAAIESLRRVLAVNDDPEIERLAMGYLASRLSDREREKHERRRTAFRDSWSEDLPFVSKDQLLTLSPRVDLGACAGPDRADVIECATSWRRWARQFDDLFEN